MGLVLSDVVGGYDSVDVLHGVSISVDPGQIVALVGSNGAGKTSTLRAVAGMLTVRQGSVDIDGASLLDRKPHERAALGIGHVPEGRQLFPQMSVKDNLILGAYRHRANAADSLVTVFGLFPVLEERKPQKARSLSGGEAQMLAIGRALMARPVYLLLDEPSLGLSPMLVEKVFETLRRLADSGVGVLLAEQNAVQALTLADDAHVIENGRVVLTGDGPSLLTRQEVVESYLGGEID